MLPHRCHERRLLSGLFPVFREQPPAAFTGSGTVAALSCFCFSLSLAPVTGPAPTVASKYIRAGILPMQGMMWGQRLSQAFSCFFVKNSQSPCLHSQSFHRLVISYSDLNLKIRLAGSPFSTFITTSSGAWRPFPCLVSPSVLSGVTGKRTLLWDCCSPTHPQLKLYFPNGYRDS